VRRSSHESIIAFDRRASKSSVAEFFAGIGLVRAALEQANFEVAFANDIEPSKRDLYRANFDDRHYRLDDVRNVSGADIPNVDLATASFPCTDLSLAGNRAGLRGADSSMFWQFARVLREMDQRRPGVVMLENVPAFATSHGGGDLRAALAELNELGYVCDLLVLDARRFVPQSRPRLFIVASREKLLSSSDWRPTELRPAWIGKFAKSHPELELQAHPLTAPVMIEPYTLAAVVQRLSPRNSQWWEKERLRRFVSSLSPVQAHRLELMKQRRRSTWATAYRRTRSEGPVWEIRADAISGCLRTARGGSSRQAVVESGRGRVRVRWMTSREYARLQGVPDFRLVDSVTENQALFGLGDAVCVPVVAWLARNYLRPLVDGHLTSTSRALSLGANAGAEAAS
jgi:DNA (cytosine-5)-methyltransferase 1